MKQRTPMKETWGGKGVRNLFCSARKQHEIKGQAICAFVSLKAGIQNSSTLADELKGHVAKKISPDDPAVRPVSGGQSD